MPRARTADVPELLERLAHQLAETESYPGSIYGRFPAARLISELSGNERAEFVRLAIARFDEISSATEYWKKGGDWLTNAAYREVSVLAELIELSLRTCLKEDPSLLEPLCEWSATEKHWVSTRDIEHAIFQAIDLKKGPPLTNPVRHWLATMRTRWGSGPSPDQRRLSRIDQMLGLGPRVELDTGEPWAAAAQETLGGPTGGAWRDLLAHCQLAPGSTPSAAWLKKARPMLDAIGASHFESTVIQWWQLAESPRTTEVRHGYFVLPVGSLKLLDGHMDILKGLCWIASLLKSKDLARALSRLAVSAYKKIPGVGPRAVKVGNAAVYALSQMPGTDALGHLALLAVKIKFGTAQKAIEKALTAAAAREGLPRDEIDELAVPTYGMTDVGRRTEPLGDFTAELTVTCDGDTTLHFVKAGGKAQASVPKAVKEENADDLKELKAAAKDIAAMLAAQKARLDSLFLQARTWPLETWRERYLDHPLVGVIARRLIWQVGRDDAWRSCTWLDGDLVNEQGKKVTPASRETVRLWHPIGTPEPDVLAWRRFFEERQIRQPFKQAHREVYLLTDAERNTVSYSNRFAAHLIRQHQFHALAAARGWKNKLRLMVDAEYPPATRILPAYGLRAEFWIEGAGQQYGEDTNDSGAYLYLTTDQVRFYAEGAPQATAHAGGGGYGAYWQEQIGAGLPLHAIPPLVFSEIMRDVDLFVGVASVGNNPEWNDGGPGGTHRTYWWRYSFGEITEAGAGRHDILSRLLPRLKIAAVCELDGKFLRVRGRLRTYKIHLGSGNILMEPNDQYLCIVPGPAVTKADTGVFLPFEGDRTLAIILSKALMLSEDDKIKDTTITRQIAR